MEKKRESLCKYAAALFWTAVFLELLLYTLGKFDVTFSYRTQILRGISVMLFGKIALTRYTKKEWAVIAVTLTVGVCGYFLSGRGIDVLLRASIFIFAARGMDVRKIFLAVFSASLAVFLGWGIQSVLGLRPLYMRMQFGRGEDELRFCFGYSHPNAFHYALWTLTTLGIYLWHGRIKRIHYLLLFVANLIVTFLTRSRTGGLLLGLTVVLFYLAAYGGMRKGGSSDRRARAPQKEKTGCRMPYIAALAGMAACVVFSAAPILFGYKNNILRYANVLLNNRLEMARAAVRYDRILHVTLFSAPENETLIDMGLVRIAYTFGWVPTALFAGCVLYLLWHAYRTQNLRNLVLLFITVLYTTLEAVQVNSGILFNYVILMTAGFWSQYREVLQKGREKRCMSGLADK